MSRLIDADALLEKMSTHCDLCQYNDHIHNCRRECDWHEAIDEVEDMDEVEIEPVRHGHWKGWTATHWTRKYDDYGDPIYKEHTYYACSGCGRRSIIKSAYCPACGRMMLEETERG